MVAKKGTVVVMCQFFFERGRPPQHLHSFPTRRSSDLYTFTVAINGTEGFTVTASPADPAKTTRSEEHTSELQSRPHLVCRLLLEKKKMPGRWAECTRALPGMPRAGPHRARAEQLGSAH